MRKKIVAGNWKMNMNLQEGIDLAKELQVMLTEEKPNCDVVICTPFIHLASIAQFLNQETIGLGAENCADKEKGAYTGEVSAEMVKSTGARFVILGHSERREYYHDTPEILKEKVLLALKNGLKVIFCIGESLAEREAGKQNEVVKAELEGSVFNLTAEEFKNIVMPRRATLFSAGYDFSVPFDVTIGPTPVLILTGIRALIDNGYFLMLCPRSGLGMKYGMQLLNTMGIIDSDYAYAENYGHIMAKVCADKEFTLKAGERFMQGIFIPFGISRNGNTLNRRTGGMGSTGSK